MNKMLGNNQTGLRQYNEKLILSLLRRQGPLPKADIARATGLSAQTVSVIMNALEEDGLLMRGAPIRGKVGQPSVPMRLAPDGAFFFGVTVGRRTISVVLVDMTGVVRDRRHIVHAYPGFDASLAFVAESVDEILADRTAAERARIGAVGIAQPGRVWDWADELGLEKSALADWQFRDFAAEVSGRTGLAAMSENDANCACAAELVFGAAMTRQMTAIYIYVGYFIGAGIAFDGRLFSGASGNAASVGSLLVPQPDGTTRQLLEVASLATLSERLEAAGQVRDAMWSFPLQWSKLEPHLSEWIDEIAPYLALCIHTATAMIEADLAIIDGYLPDPVRARLVLKVEDELARLDFRGLVQGKLREGSFGVDARALGAAAVPLADRFLV